MKDVLALTPIQFIGWLKAGIKRRNQEVSFLAVAMYQAFGAVMGGSAGFKHFQKYLNMLEGEKTKEIAVMDLIAAWKAQEGEK